MLYVCAHFDRMPPRMSQHARLYAFPARPEPGWFVVLDSGAWGLSRRRRQIGPVHMRRLAEYYRPYAGRPGYHCIAPDAYLDPRLTMQNWRWWQEHIGLPVAPVIQFPAAGRIDVYAGLKQAEFYAAWQPDVMSISNPALRATASTANELLAAEVRHITGCRWLHNLGAGWSPADIADWRDLACFDSIDSVAYYTDAQRGVRWRLDGRTERSAAPWRQIAVENAGVAAQIAGSTAFGGRY